MVSKILVWELGGQAARDVQRNRLPAHVWGVRAAREKAGSRPQATPPRSHYLTGIMHLCCRCPCRRPPACSFLPRYRGSSYRWSSSSSWPSSWLGASFSPDFSCLPSSRPACPTSSSCQPPSPSRPSRPCPSLAFLCWCLLPSSWPRRRPSAGPRLPACSPPCASAWPSRPHSCRASRRATWPWSGASRAASAGAASSGPWPAPPCGSAGH
mmetsp:Transcript_78553/g.243692  ORF Transcript_78553/g.243692 Transcript_78553/m.243692 type:complete len:211 (+) Transcript_78553:138-770(+)